MNLQRVIALNNELEERLKAYQQKLGAFPVEVLNEHRYALRAAMELLQKADFSSLRDEEVESAQIAEERLHHALMCAYHDLVDSILVEFTDALNSCIQQYPAATFEAMGDRREWLLAVLNDASALVRQSRGEPPERRDLYQKIYQEHFDNLTEAWNFFRFSVVPRVMEIERVLQERRENTEKGLRGVSLFAALMGLTAIIASVVSALL